MIVAITKVIPTVNPFIIPTVTKTMNKFISWMTPINPPKTIETMATTVTVIRTAIIVIITTIPLTD